jgi:hypothetical protein
MNEHDLAREHEAENRSIAAAVWALRIARALPYVLTGAVCAICAAMIVWGGR